jgi:hypothetical protein
MKTTRQQLKVIIKECLVEILMEGIDSPVLAEAVRRKPTNGASKKPTNGPSRKYSGLHMNGDVGPGREPTDVLKQAVMQEAKGDPLMQQLLADTATRTLPNMLGAEGPGSVQDVPMLAEMAEQHAPTGLPLEAFPGADSDAGDEEGDSHWAQLAFMPPKDDKKTA